MSDLKTRPRTGRACLSIRRLADVDHQVLRELVTRSVAQMSRLVND